MANTTPLRDAFPPPGLSIRPVDPAADPRWDGRLASFPDASFFHTAAWARVLADTYGFKPVYFALTEGETLRALLPLFEVDSWLTGRRGVGLPFTDESGPLCPDDATFQQLQGAAMVHALERHWKSLEVRGGRAFFGLAPASTSFYGHVLDLQHPEAEIFARVDSSVRRAVRKAEQSGLTLSVSQDLSAVETFYALLCKTRQRHGLPAQPFRFFSQIHRHILSQNHGQIVLAHRGTTPVAGAVFFHFGGKVTYKFGASDEKLQHLRANNLVMWEAIRWHAERKFAQLDFGRTSLPNAGLRKFKLGWGTTERSVDYVKYDFKTHAFVTTKDAASGWHNHVFRHLPVALSRIAGVLLYPHIA